MRWAFFVWAGEGVGCITNWEDEHFCELLSYYQLRRWTFDIFGELLYFLEGEHLESFYRITFWDGEYMESFYLSFYRITFWEGEYLESFYRSFYRITFWEGEYLESFYHIFIIVPFKKVSIWRAFIVLPIEQVSMFGELLYDLLRRWVLVEHNNIPLYQHLETVSCSYWKE